MVLRLPPSFIPAFLSQRLLKQIPQAAADGSLVAVLGDQPLVGLACFPGAGKPLFILIFRLPVPAGAVLADQHSTPLALDQQHIFAADRALDL